MTTTTVPAPPSFAAVDPFSGMDSELEDVGMPKSALFYAESGRQKTRIAGGLAKVPGFNYGLFIDIDNGTEILRTDPQVWAAILRYQKTKDTPNPSGLRIIKIDKTKPLEAKAKIDYLISQITTKDLGYDYVVLDTLDVAQQCAEAEFQTKFEGWDIWREVGTWTTELVADLHNCPFFFAHITAHAETKEDKTTGRIRTLPALGGSSKNTIASDTSMTVFLDYRANPADPKDVRLVAFMGKSENYITKNRFGLPDEVVDFNMPMFFAAIAANNANADAVIAANAPDLAHPTNTTTTAAVAA